MSYSLKISAFILVCLSFTSTNIFGIDLYWVGGGANNDFSTVDNWSTTPGGTPGDYGNSPQSTDDVHFLPPYANGLALTINAPAVCHDMIWDAGVTGASISGGNFLDLYGSMSLIPNLTSASWTGVLNFFSSGADTLTLSGNKLYNSTIEFKPFGGQFVVTDDFEHVYNAASGGHQLYMTTNNGTIEFQGNLTVGYKATIGQNTKVLVQGRLLSGTYAANGGLIQESGRLTVEGVTSLQGGFELNGGDVFFAQDSSIYLRNININTTSANDTIDFRNCRVSIGAEYFCAKGGQKVLAEGSTLSLNNNSTFFGGEKEYNVIDGRGYVEFGSGNNNYHMSFTVDTLLLRGGATVINGNQSRFINVGGGSFGPGYLKLFPSTEIYNFGRSYTEINIASTATVEIVGVCDTLVFLNHSQFNFASPAGTGGQLLMDYVNMGNNVATGADAPYAAGAGSYQTINTTNTGWDVGVPTPRYLRWVGAIAANISDASTYAVWENANNWRDGAVVPTASPNNPIGTPTCPPTFYDSVVFPNDSYVITGTVLPVNECKHMIWEEDGRMHGQQTSRLQIWGSLYFSPEMTNSSLADFYFHAWEKGQTITSNGKAINRFCIFSAVADTAEWFLQDSLAVPYNNVNYYQPLKVYRGNLHTQGSPVLAAQVYITNANLYMYDSDFWITGGYWNNGGPRYAWVNTASTATTKIHGGTSHIRFTNTRPDEYLRMVSNGGHTFYDITFQNGAEPRLALEGATKSDSIHHLTFRHSGSLEYRAGDHFIQKLETHKASEPSQFRFGYTGSTYSATADMEIDTGVFHGSVRFYKKCSWNNQLYFAPGKTYILENTYGTQTLNAANVLDANGTCSEKITIQNGLFVSSFDQQGSYLTITNNQATSAVFNAYNSEAFGTTTGWDVPDALPRKLYWIDTIPGVSTGQWNDPSSWSLADGYMLDQLGGNDFGVGNCLPTRIDTVVFTDNSFTGNDIVNIDMGTTAADCHTMDWSGTITTNAVLTTSNPNTAVDNPGDGQQLRIFGSLIFSPSMTNNFNSRIIMTGSDSTNIITMAGQTIKRWLLFTGAEPVAWYLQDELKVTSAVVRSLQFLRGTLHTQGNTIRTFQFYSKGSNPRTLNLEDSDIIITGYYLRPSYSVYHDVWETDSRTDGLLINGEDAHIIFTNGVTNRAWMKPGNDHRFGDVTFNNYGRIIDMKRDTFGVVTFGTGGGGYFGLDVQDVSNVAQKIHFYGFGVLGAHATQVDTVIFETSGQMWNNNYYRKLLKFTAGRTYKIGSGRVQHIANDAEFYPVGLPGNKITLQATTTGTRGFIRKDSGQICADYIFMRDIFAVGDGVSTSTGCVSVGCDTLITDSYVPDTKTSGRARFFAGADADDQGNNAGWDFSPYPPTPEVDLPTPDKDVCSNELVTVTFEFVGITPAYFTYDSAGVLIDTVLTRPWHTFGSQDVTVVSVNGTDTTYQWVYQTYFPAYEDSLVIQAVDMSFERCFVGDANVTGDVKFTWVCWDPLPVELVNFDAYRQGDVAYLSWQTASEINNSHFNVQRSLDGENFETIGKLDGAGNSTQLLNYQFVDSNPSLRNFYRLEQVDFDGTPTLSDIRVVDFDGSGDIAVYPNPATNYVSVQTSLKGYGFKVYDLSGKLIFYQTSAQGNEQIDVSELSKGIYIYEVTTQDGISIKKDKLEVLD